MDRRNFLKTSAAVTAAAAVFGPTKAFAVANPTYPRSLHFMYPQLLQAQNETYTSLTKALNKVNNPELTFLSPLFLNVTDYSGYSEIISYCNTNNIKFGPAVGGPGPGNKLMDGNGPNQTCLEAINTAGFQPYLRVDNLSGFYGNDGGEDDIKSFLRQAIGYGFYNIMLNPWPQMPQGKPNAGMYMPIAESDIIPYIDSCFQNANYQDYTVIDADIQNILTQAQNWAQGTPQILINYESPGPQGTIAAMSFQNQINTFNTTENSIKTYPAGNHLHFALPFTGSYDPLKEKNKSGTTIWDFYMVPLIETWTQGA